MCVSVCLSVCLSVYVDQTDEPCKQLELIGRLEADSCWGHVEPRIISEIGPARGRHLANTVEQSVLGGNTLCRGHCCCSNLLVILQQTLVTVHKLG